MMWLLALLLLLLPTLAHAQTGFILVGPGTQRATCTAITAPVTNQTWCADGSLGPSNYNWFVWNGTAWVPIAGGTGGVPGAPKGSTQFNDTGNFGGSLAPLHVEAFGTNGAAIQAAITAAPSGGLVQLAPIAYTVSDVSTITINKALTLRCTNSGQVYAPDGAPPVNSRMIGGPSQTILTVNTNQSVTIEDCQFTNGSSGTAISLTGAQANADSRIQRNSFYGGSFGVVGVAGKTIGTTLRDNVFSGQGTAGTLLQGYASGGFNCDGGGYTLDNNYFVGTGGTDAMKFVNSAAVTVTNNQAISYTNALTVTTSACVGPAPGQFHVRGNQFEVGAGAGHAINVAINYSLNSMIVVGNYLGTTFGTNTDALRMEITSGPGNFANLVIGDNTFVNVKKSSIYIRGPIATGTISNNVLGFGSTNPALDIVTTGYGVLVTNNTVKDPVASQAIYAGSGYTLISPYNRDGQKLANLPAVDNGSQVWCEDCQPINSVCQTGIGGTGTLALRRAGSWQCFSSGETFVVDDQGANTIQAAIIGTGVSGANLVLRGNDLSVPNKFIRSNSDSLEFLDDAYSAVLFRVNDIGEFTVPGLASAGLCIITDGAGTFSTGACGAGSPPAAPVGSTQFNDTGVLGGDAAPIHVKAFGTTRAQIQAAITAAPSGSIVQFDCVTYNLDNVTLTIDKPLTLRGCTMLGGGVGTPSPTTGTRLLGGTGAGVPTITINTLYAVTIENLYMTVAPGADGIFITATVAPTFPNLWSLNVGSIIRNNWFVGGRYQVWADAGKAAETIVTYNTFTSPTGAATWLRGLKNPASPTNNCDGGGYHFVGNRIEGATTDGYRFTNTAALSFTDNRVLGVMSGAGLHIFVGPTSGPDIAPCVGSGPTQNLFTANQITNSGTGPAFWVEATFFAGDWTIGNNFFGAEANDVVYLQTVGGGANLFRITYTGNTHQTISQVGKGALHIDGAQNVTVSGNTLSMGANVTNYAFKGENLGDGVLVVENPITNPVFGAVAYQGSGYTLATHFNKAGFQTVAALASINVLDSSTIWANDATATNPCSGSGTGAQANRVGGVWNCGASGISGGANTQIAVFTGPGALGSSSDFTWDVATGRLLAFPDATITGTVERTTVLGSRNTITLDGTTNPVLFNTILNADTTSLSDDTSGILVAAGSKATLVRTADSAYLSNDGTSATTDSFGVFAAASFNPTIDMSTRGAILATEAGVITQGEHVAILGAKTASIITSGGGSIASTSVVLGGTGGTVDGGAGNITNAVVLGGTNGSVTGASNAVSINGGVVTTSDTTVVGGQNFNHYNGGATNLFGTDISDSATTGIFFTTAVTASGANAEFSMLPDPGASMTLKTDDGGGNVAQMTYDATAGIFMEMAQAGNTGSMQMNASAVNISSSAGFVGLNGFTGISLGGPSVFFTYGGHAAGASIKTVTEETTILVAAFTDTAIQAPANSLVLGVSVRVTTIIPTAATFDVGVAGATTRYGTGILVAATTTFASPGTTNPTIYGSATSIRITPDLTPLAATGKVRVTITYLDLTPPSS